MKTLKSHTSGLGSTWSLLDNENNLTAICPRVNPDDGLQISADEAERLLTDCVANGNDNPDEESNMWVHAVQPPDEERDGVSDGLDVYAWESRQYTNIDRPEELPPKVERILELEKAMDEIDPGQQARDEVHRYDVLYNEWHDLTKDREGK
tara:strand:- start:148 stop:600 length:453 start_codon:yes stop_codon:yes gene_type:complete